ncbi:MAG: hypothetical protein KA224_03415 [Steroidobacteraceae bacterium]|nr:hypothetical protein [Steroidobacteraceae bacterium]MCC7200652.1 hypothetical protein [Gammaproteobacteria bacterium]
MSQDIRFVSQLPATQYVQLEALLFFNGRQERVRSSIVAAIERYGPPQVVESDGSLRVQLNGLDDAQCLFAVDVTNGRERPVGVILYVRESFERITVVHLSVAEQFAAGGVHADDRLLYRMVQAVRQVARRTVGIERVDLFYSQGRPRAAFA